MDPSEARRRFSQEQRVVLATRRADGTTDLVPVTFAVDGDRVVTTVDHKPKTTMALRRLRNVTEDPHVTLLADGWDDDWSRLWWVRAKGLARVVEEGAERDEAARLVASRYTQYDDQVPAGPAIIVEVEQWLGWSAGGL